MKTKACICLFWSLLCAVVAPAAEIVHRGVADFSRGHFEDGGSNLYVNAKGEIEWIHSWDVNSDGFPDLVLANSHDYIERGPTRVFHPRQNWRQQDLSADSGWMSRVADMDADGHPDLVVANGENGVSSDLLSYIYWGGPKGLTGERTDLSTVGAYDVAIADVNRDGRLDLLFPSAWRDHHNPGVPMPARVYLQQPGRRFVNETLRYNLLGSAALSIAAADLNGDGFLDVALANNRFGHKPEGESFVYWGNAQGFDVKSPLALPSRGAQQVLAADLNGDRRHDLLFTGAGQVIVYWNRNGRFSSGDRLALDVSGSYSQFGGSAVKAAISDVDGDGAADLILATGAGIEIRSSADLKHVSQSLPFTQASWVSAVDIDGDRRPDLIVSRRENDNLYDTNSAIFWNRAGRFSLDAVQWVPTKGAVGNTAGDLDGDGRAEIVFNNTMSGHSSRVPTYVYLGSKDGQYSTTRRLELSTVATDESVIADLDLDGYPDLAFTAPNGVRIIHGGANGPGDRVTLLPTENRTIQELFVADFNHDGWLDVMAVGTVLDPAPDKIAKATKIFYGSSSGFAPARASYLPSNGMSAHLADFNRDGKLDVAFTDKRGYILIYWGGASGFDLSRTSQVPCTGLATGGKLTSADLNEDGWLDLVVSTLGHYTGLKDTLHIFYGGPHGFSRENMQSYMAGYSPGHITIADFNRDGHLDLVITAYSSANARVLPAQLFWGNGKRFDFERPFNLPGESTVAATAMDFNHDGWIDLALACHRNDLGHQVDSLIYWNGPLGFSPERVTRLPGLGPHGMTMRDFGNAYRRAPEETYSSPVLTLDGGERISWDATVPAGCELRVEVHGATSREALDTAEWHAASRFPENAKFGQYRAIFVSPAGACSPRLRQVKIAP